jgi:hypothetical protein
MREAGRTPQPVRCAVIAASERDPATLVTQGRLRWDLWRKSGEGLTEGNFPLTGPSRYGRRRKYVSATLPNHVAPTLDCAWGRSMASVPKELT